MPSPGFTPDFVNYLEELDRKIKTMVPVDVSQLATKDEIKAVKDIAATKDDIKAVKDIIPAIDTSAVATKTDIKAVRDAIPKPYDAIPAVETQQGAMGNKMEMFAAGDHSHARVSEVVKGTLNTSSQLTVSFVRMYDSEPGISLVSVGAASPILWDVVFITNTEGKFTGATITGRKGRSLPALTAVLTTLVASISNYDPFGGSAAGVRFSGVVIKS